MKKGDAYDKHLRQVFALYKQREQYPLGSVKRMEINMKLFPLHERSKQLDAMHNYFSPELVETMGTPAVKNFPLIKTA